MSDFFSEETPWRTRKQILDYHASQLMSDSERARFFGLPESCRMRENAKIISPENLVIGENVWIGEGAILDASGGLEIGDNCQIGLGVFLWSHDSHKAAVKGQDTRTHRGAIIRKRTTVGKNTFIAGPAVVMPGVAIGEKCIVSPMSVVYEDLPDRTVFKPYRGFLDLAGAVGAQQEAMDRMAQEIKELRALVEELSGGRPRGNSSGERG